MMEIEILKRRDVLLDIERKIRVLWEEHDVFRAEPGNQYNGNEKFFGNFPLPYMNGFLHIGHAFSLSKLEFAAAYHRLRGANVLLPFAFHCSGMPIKASADKLRQEIQIFGGPPDDYDPQLMLLDRSQWEKMRSFGLSDTLISKFQEPSEWLRFFPSAAIEDLKSFGFGCDWRRSFVTTDLNPYFNSFVQWQMSKLKSMGKIVRDIGYTIYSPLDGQPCSDHDRSIGEGVKPLEQTIIKMELLPPFPSKMRPLEGKRVFLAASTLRPETLYGQTNAWVLADAKYGAFEINETDVFILTHRAALNLSFQNFSRFPQKASCLIELIGYDLIGLPLRSPLAFYEVIYVLPMFTILTDKGTGILTSVPTVAPDDYMAFHDLKSKPALRENYGVKDEWLMPFEIVPIINIPEYGDMAAQKVCLDLEIKSQHHSVKLAEAKRLTYLNEGTLLVGEFAGRKAQEAKPLIRAKLIDAGEAIAYSEPEKRVVSRSGDECVVARSDQWYITYGDQEWKKLVEECLSNMNLYSDDTKHEFEQTLRLLNQWPFSRSYGLGTRIPWDTDFLVESLSDSTMYMAYYTVAHLLHKDDMYGTNKTHPVQPAQMSDEVWDFIICDGPYPNSSSIPSSMLEKMKEEFEYWYPFDLRVSGKDLIQNHLTFCIYSHTAIMAKHHWPRGFRCNGHIMLNSEKMAKSSTGKIRTLRQAIQQFSADGMRLALASVGDGVGDARFEFKTANAAIIILTEELFWIEKVLVKESYMRRGPPSTYADLVFENKMNIAVKMTEQSYQDYMFRAALKSGFHYLQAARCDYEFSFSHRIEDMNRDLIWRYMDLQTRLITPICPHYAEYVWRELLKNDGFVVNAGWPMAGCPDLTLQAADKYLQDSIKSFKYQLLCSKKAIKKGPDVARPTEDKMIGLIYVIEQYDGWRAECLRILQSKFDSNNPTFPPDAEIMEALKNTTIGCATDFNQVQKLCLPFLKSKKDEALATGAQALEMKLPFKEFEVLQENVDVIRRKLYLNEVEILCASNADAVAKAGSQVSVLNQNFPSPGKPSIIFLPRKAAPSLESSFAAD